ncbi:nucleotidyltransferase family protein [Neobacillus sp. OS1-32]|uniref:nucleotidyltransferase family protein n=1 Tax=Neobacillus sp. OS1-32 TaxID=3070682 RepID=UPI0027E02452|nr:nucleotidyltransferase family protein [Neobacillus sp. OS1-32]WML31113.1 nucleotidyltransferase family protein [Neobacillus sp. OS1-32]
MMTSVGAIVLAAGTSTRMGFPKPLLHWNGTTLLEHQVNQLLRLPCSEIIIVLGHESKMILKKIAIADPRVKVLECRDYHQGLSSSLKCGLKQAAKKDDAVMLMLVDLPLIRVETIKQVFEHGVRILAAGGEPFAVQPMHQNQKGHPVFLGFFNKLNWQNLQGDQGAKPLIQQLKHHILLETNDEGVIYDVDTPEAYENALTNSIFQKR